MSPTDGGLPKSEDEATCRKRGESFLDAIFAGVGPTLFGFNFRQKECHTQLRPLRTLTVTKSGTMVHIVVHTIHNVYVHTLAALQREEAETRCCRCYVVKGS